MSASLARRSLLALAAAGCLLVGGCAGASGGPLADLNLTHRTIASDTADEDDPIPFWGSIDCERDSRHGRIERGGDPGPTATGAPQPDGAFRRLTVLDGDDFYGERCELGANDRDSSPVLFYQEGARRLTFLSVRLPEGFPLEAEDWQGVMQMKQTQPANNGGGTPVLSLSAFGGRWRLFHSGPGPTTVDRELWSVPARIGLWTRIALDVTYSQHASGGSVEAFIDLDGDGNFDREERSPRFRLSTLKREIDGDSTHGIEPGESIPSHLRVGLYRNPVIACDSPRRCFIDVDNVQVVAPGLLGSLLSRWRSGCRCDAE